MLMKKWINFTQWKLCMIKSVKPWHTQKMERVVGYSVQGVEHSMYSFLSCDIYVYIYIYAPFLHHGGVGRWYILPHVVMRPTTTTVVAAPSASQWAWRHDERCTNGRHRCTPHGTTASPHHRILLYTVYIRIPCIPVKDKSVYVRPTYIYILLYIWWWKNHAVSYLLFCYHYYHHQYVTHCYYNYGRRGVETLWPLGPRP